MCMHTMYMSGVCRSQKRALDALDLELQMFLSYHVGIQVFCKSNKCF